MITFKNNNLTYIPSVDLTTLGNTFNTLEEGHKKAIQTASELENTIAKLEMDESESDFKEGLIADIQAPDFEIFRRYLHEVDLPFLNPRVSTACREGGGHSPLEHNSVRLHS